jgi:hyperosmotically inducible periplasmic protein
LVTERWRGLVLIGCVAVVLGACATFDPLEDTRIESEVKARLVAEKDANLTRVGVVSSKGTVYLSGTVGTPEQRARAAMLANGVNGVGRVVNTLEVRPASR